MSVLNKDVMYIGIVGDTGSGKSSFINNILGTGDGDGAPVSHGADSSTVKVKQYPSTHYTLPNGQSIALVDTPGFNSYISNKAMTPGKVLKQMEAFLGAGVKYSYIFVVQSVTAHPIVDLKSREKTAFNNLCDKANVFVVTTHWDDAYHHEETGLDDEGVADAVEEQICAPPSFLAYLKAQKVVFYRSGKLTGGTPVANYIPPLELIYKVFNIVAPKTTLGCEQSETAMPERGDGSSSSAFESTETSILTSAEEQEDSSIPRSTSKLALRISTDTSAEEHGLGDNSLGITRDLRAQSRHLEEITTTLIGHHKFLADLIRRPMTADELVAVTNERDRAYSQLDALLNENQSLKGKLSSSKLALKQKSDELQSSAHELDIVVSHQRRLIADLDTTKDERDKLSDKLKVLVAREEVSDAEIKKARLAFEHQSQQLAAIRTERDNFAGRIEQLITELDLIKRERDALSMESTAALDQLQATSDILKLNQEELDAVKKNRDERLAEMEAAASSRAGELEKLVEERNELEKRTVAARRLEEELYMELEGKDNEMSRMALSLKSKTEELDTLKKERNKDDAPALRTRIAKLNKELSTFNSVRSDIKIARDQISQLKGQLQSATGLADQRSQELLQLRGETDQLSHKSTARISALEDELKAVRASLLQSGDNSGRRTTPPQRRGAMDESMVSGFSSPYNQPGRMAPLNQQSFQQVPPPLPPRSPFPSPQTFGPNQQTFTPHSRFTYQEPQSYETPSYPQAQAQDSAYNYGMQYDQYNQYNQQGLSPTYPVTAPSFPAPRHF